MCECHLTGLTDAEFESEVGRGNACGVAGHLVPALPIVGNAPSRVSRGITTGWEGTLLCISGTESGPKETLSRVDG